MDNNELLQAILDELKDLKQGQAKLEQNQSDMYDDVRILKVSVENNIIPSIQLLGEGHRGLSDKLSRIDDMANDIEEIKGAIVAVEAIARHTI